MARVFLDRLSKRFDDVEVVKSITLEIKDKEFMVLVGPSGCGKSTTLRMIAGLETPSAGEIYFDDRAVTDLAVKDRNIAMVFQNYALYPHMNVYRNMGFGLKMRGADKAQVDEAVRRSAGILGIEALLDRRPRQLSGGQRQRVALGRAIVRDPDAFLLDEPLSNLDAKLRVQTRGEIVKLRNRLEATMVYVTHDQVEAMSMGDRIVVMNEGEIQQVGAPMEVYSNPANVFVAGFVGGRSMNFFDGVLRSNQGAPEVRLAATAIALPDRLRQAVGGMADARVTLGVRPEHLSVAPLTGAEAPPGGIAAQVEIAEPLGATLVLELSSECGDIVAEVAPDTQARVGDRVQVSMDRNKLHLFDAKSGRSVTAGGYEFEASQ